MTYRRFRLRGMMDPYRIRPVETWLAARNDYLSGLSAEVVCHRYDLDLSAFRKRAQKHGWRRADQSARPAREVDLDIYDFMSPEEEVDMARRRYFRALEHGSSGDVIRWRRIWMSLREDFEAEQAEIFAGMTAEEIQEVKEETIVLEDHELDLALAKAPLPEATPPDAPVPQASASQAEEPIVHYVHSENFAPVPPPGAAPPGEPLHALYSPTRQDAGPINLQKPVLNTQNLTSAQKLKTSTSAVAWPPDTTSPPPSA